MDYKKGDRIKVIGRFKSSADCFWTSSMNKLIGCEGVVYKADSRTGYSIIRFPQFDVPGWTESWLMKSESFELASTIKFKPIYEL